MGASIASSSWATVELCADASVRVTVESPASARSVMTTAAAPTTSNTTTPATMPAMTFPLGADDGCRAGAR
ncbi:hypothetical protein CQY20_06510 [Mycolicibacterium agri]|uniref:Uncharacterized protein n=1 Tax=Mycolicibacterium agri TaxID=36811 RepID=A0A2A7N9X7_MYCAG|nr:hypothetical protein CQY20_06510 [Mycolicibacterium agri]